MNCGIGTNRKWNYRHVSKPEKPKKPGLEMTGNGVDSGHPPVRHLQKACRHLGRRGTRLLACLGREVYGVLFSAYSGTISDPNEKTLKENIMRLAGQMST